MQMQRQRQRELHECDDGVVVERDTKTHKTENGEIGEIEENEWQVESDCQQVEKGSDTTSFMEWVRKRVPIARYPEWSTGAQREKQIQATVERLGRT
jgi:hypothetical protein